jgi:hypothetical protein
MLASGEPLMFNSTLRSLGMEVAAGEFAHLALPPNALCPSGERQIGLQKAGIGSPGFCHRDWRPNGGAAPGVSASGGAPGGIPSGGGAITEAI